MHAKQARKMRIQIRAYTYAYAYAHAHAHAHAHAYAHAFIRDMCRHAVRLHPCTHKKSNPIPIPWRPFEGDTREPSTGDARGRAGEKETCCALRRAMAWVFRIGFWIQDSSYTCTHANAHTYTYIRIHTYTHVYTLPEMAQSQ